MPTDQPAPTHLPVDDAALQAYYRRGEEADRLATGLGRVEFLRTVELIERVLPSPPATVADVGGGPGRYTDHLLALGHHVVHRDLVADHVDQVRARHPESGPTGDRLDAMVGDARSLDLADHSVDTVLLLGPLYHLTDPADRQAVLAEASRVVRPGGAVVAAAISRHSVLLDGILMKRVDLVYPQILDLLDLVQETGVIPPLFDGSFNGYAHRPAELAQELTTAGLVVDDLVAVEGVAVTLGDVEDRLADPKQRERLLSTLRRLESAPDMLGISSHLLVLATAPG